jgi:hypothetical protein
MRHFKICIIPNANDGVEEKPRRASEAVTLTSSFYTHLHTNTHFSILLLSLSLSLSLSLLHTTIHNTPAHTHRHTNHTQKQALSHTHLQALCLQKLTHTHSLTLSIPSTFSYTHRLQSHFPSLSTLQPKKSPKSIKLFFLH